MVWVHSRSQAGAQGQRLGRCSTGVRAGRASRAGAAMWTALGAGEAPDL